MTDNRNYLNPFTFSWHNTDCDEFLPMCMIGIKWLLLLPLIPLYCIGLLYGYMCDMSLNRTD